MENGRKFQEQDRQLRRNFLPRRDAKSSSSRLSVAYIAAAKLKLNPRNPRLHSHKQIKQIAKSIQAFGFNVPVLVDRELNVIAGHGRLLACKQLVIEEVPTINLLFAKEESWPGAEDRRNMADSPVGCYFAE